MIQDGSLFPFRAFEERNDVNPLKLKQRKRVICPEKANGAQFCVL